MSRSLEQPSDEQQHRDEITLGEAIGGAFISQFFPSAVPEKAESRIAQIAESMDKQQSAGMGQMMAQQPKMGR